MYFRPTSTIHWLIVLSVLCTIVAGFVQQSGYSPYAFGMHRYFWEQGAYVLTGLQVLLFEFLHGGVLHLLSNSLFLVVIGIPLEHRKGSRWMLSFFLVVHILLACVLGFQETPTVGMSGFAMAILAYCMLELSLIHI